MSYADFFLNCNYDVIQYELIEIEHPNFSKIYRIVRNNTEGITVKLENGIYYTFDYYPLKITLAGDKDNLDQIVKIELGDLGEIVSKEFDLIRSANGFSTKPTVKYRTYRSDDLDNILFGPYNMEVDTFSFNREGCVFEAKAPSLNIGRTGEIYSIDRFPMLKGLL